MDFSDRRGWRSRSLPRLYLMMKIFTDEFSNFVKQILICSWRGHKKGKLIEVYWAMAHSAGYKSRFCEICHKELETTRRKATFVPSEA
jgi:hypothetical protein